ncbi:acyltransferase family protein [Raineyella fluvialis]|uniref:Acyltransferase family protein n=1 Tax=Raineyella fluvialis TaxID=2662261 RepID=A0A5Q2FAA3_9ACTN|nr:acyltransferase [Raineyella fluvialis]QGF23900.1 acyltransferase family protein [Raineyella fluvialis]
MGRQVWTGLDGVRAIGVIAVVLYHASLGFSVNGYVGVDIFFALSGFLITWLLVAERERTGRVSISDFYARRGLRLLPALMVTLAMVSFLSIASERPGVILRGALASLLYVSNWWKFTGHDMPLLDHTWTLAIEEHFYLIWPLLVLLGSSRSRARRVPALVLGVALIVVMVLPWAPSVALVKGTYLRGVSILLGSLLAVGMYFRPPVGRTARLLGPLAGLSCVLLVAVTVTWVALPIRWMSGITSVPAWLTLVLVAASVAAPQSRVVRACPACPFAGSVGGPTGSTSITSPCSVC